MAELYLIRHAQASFGMSDYDRLSPLGCRQAGALGEYFRDCAIHFDAVYSGELERQRRTAKIVQPKLTQHIGIVACSSEGATLYYRTISFEPMRLRLA